MESEDLIIAAAFLMAGVMAVRRQIRKRQFVREWAERHGYTIVRRLRAWYRISPFLFAELGSKQSIAGASGHRLA